METALSLVDGERGLLLVRGKTLEELATEPSLEAVAALLWTDVNPARASSHTREQLVNAFAEARVHAFSRISSLGAALDLPDAMDGLRAALAQLSPTHGAAEPENGTTAGISARWADGVVLAGATAVFASAWFRRRQGLAPVAPNPALSPAADYLRMLQDAAPDPARERALATYLVTVADHGMNASTYAARVVASTGSDAVSAIVAGIGALKGPLHGGAPGPVLDMLDAIGSPQHADAWLRAELAQGKRIMGMGHRIYRVRDPRAAVLERALEELERALEELERTGTARGRLPLARAVETAATKLLAEKHPERPLRTNVEFFTAILLDALGIDRRLFTATFAVGRVVGWYAHVLEQRRSGKLIRPDSRYVGPVPKANGVSGVDSPA